MGWQECGRNLKVVTRTGCVSGAVSTLMVAIKLCPHCGSNQVRRSHRTGPERLMAVFLKMRPYRCLHCYERFYCRGFEKLENAEA
jgi:hypothetical protein